MTSEALVVAVIDALDALHVPFMLSGSLASNFYGVPRATQDADLVLDLAKLPLDELASRLAAHFDTDRQAGFESVTGSVRLVMRARRASFDVELFGLTDDRHDRERWARRTLVHVLDRHVALPTAEDVVLNKLRWFARLQRRKDVDDARHVIAVQRARLDWPYMERWARELALAPYLDAVR